MIRINLTDALPYLRRLNEHKKLYGLAERYQAVESIILDLSAARVALVKLYDIDASVSEAGVLSDGDAIIGQALAFNAVMLYARATETSSKSRSSIAIRPWLTERQVEMHNHFMTLRNDCLGHFGSRRGVRHGWWNREALQVTVDEEGSLDVMFTYARANYFGHDVQELGKLIDAVREKATELAEKRYWALMAELASAPERLQEYLIRKYPYDEQSYFGHALGKDGHLSPDDGVVHIRYPRALNDG